MSKSKVTSAEAKTKSCRHRPCSAPSLKSSTSTTDGASASISPFALPLPKKYSTLMLPSPISDSCMTVGKTKFVKVDSYGEVEMIPDVVEFCVKITTSKTEPEAAKASVKKRKDFVLLALKKFGVDEGNIATFVIAKRLASPNNPEDLQLNGDDDGIKILHVKDKKGLKYSEEICVKCSSMETYTTLRSICNEKLDKHVEFSRPVVRCSPDHIQRKTQEAVRLAMDNATKKASEIIFGPRKGASLGKLCYCIENSLRITPMKDYDRTESFETFGWKRLNKTIGSSLTSMFEFSTKPMQQKK